MEDKHENEKLIGKLIKKRKQENDAFFKLLDALETKNPAEPAKDKKKSNPKL